MPPGLRAILRRHSSISTPKWFGKRSRFGQSIEVEGRLVMEQRGETKGRGSGLTTVINYAAVYTFRAGKVLTVKEYNTFGRALEAVGLSEQDAAD